MLVSNIITEVRKVVQLRPDVIYNSGGNGCKYGAGECSDGSIGCLFGQVLSNLGENVDRFDKYPVSDSVECVSTYVPSIDRILKREFEGSERELNWCAIVQQQQDNGLSWKEAVKEADLEFDFGD